MRRLLALILLSVPGLALAQDDWLSLQVPDPMPGAHFEAGAQVLTGQSASWAHGAFSTDATKFTGLVLPNGGTQTVAVNSVDLELQLRWKFWRSLLVEADLPLRFIEVSNAQAAPGTSYPPNDPSVLRGGGLGDVSLGLRGPWLGSRPGLQLGWSFGFIAPTGQGPFDATTPLAATGAGRWQVQPGLILGGGGDGALEAWVQAKGRWQFGREAWVSSQAPLGFTGDAAHSTYLTPKANGAQWLDPRWGGDAAVGLGWNWYRDAEQRQTLAVELLGHWLSPWSMSGVDQGLGAEDDVQLQPELQAHFGSFAVTGGWRSSVLYGHGVLDPGWGLVLLNAAYAF